MENEQKNFGIDLDLEQQHVDGTEWQFGAQSEPCIASVPIAYREQYLPVGEAQNWGEEKFSCVTRGYLNILETKLTYKYQTNGFAPETRKWLEDNGYVDNGIITLSDAFNAILSGTTRQGNSLKAPADSIHRDGVIPKKLLPQLYTWDEDNNPARITPKLRALGAEFLKRLPLFYEQVKTSDLDVALMYDMTELALFGWPSEANGEYPRVELNFNHSVMAFKTPKTYIFDNYTDFIGSFIKKLATNYKLYEYGYRIYIQKEIVIVIPLTPTEENQLLIAMRQLSAVIKSFIEWLTKQRSIAHGN